MYLIGQVPLPDLMASLLKRRKTPEREAWLAKICTFMGQAFESRFNELTSLKKAGDIKVSKGQAMKPHDELALAEAPSWKTEGLGEDEKGAKRRRVRSMATWLQHQFWVWAEIFHVDKQGVVHIATDGARAGGKESILSVLYHAGAHASVWAPPLDPGVK